MARKNISRLLILLILTILCALAVQYALNLCFWWNCAPERGFIAADLELPDYLFPEGAVVDEPSRIRDNLVINDMWQGVTWGTGESTRYFAFIVRGYPTIRRAEETFIRDQNQLSREPWRPSNELQFESSFSDESISACGNWAGYRCEYTARYQEFVLTVHSMIDDEMTYDRFEDIVEYVDGQIASRLYP
ncbi:MAG: hypothetical protein IPG44_15005 [Anaerolineales bacterium]|jgi:hypothetical protein|nr:hypothetical protein [Anaerolineales bacterium]